MRSPLGDHAIHGISTDQLKDEFARIKARHLHPPTDDPYAVLGVEPGLSDRELKERYRALVRANHPDKHMAAGVPPELIDIATRRLAAINSAYRAIAKARGS